MEFKAANDGEETQPRLLAEGTMAESHSHVILPSRWSLLEQEAGPNLRSSCRACTRTALMTYLNSIGPFFADRPYNRHPGRGTTSDHPSATVSPVSSVGATRQSSRVVGRIRCRPV